MSTSHGVVQGYTGVTVVDGKHQVVVNAQAYGEGQEQALLRPMLEGASEHLEATGRGGDGLSGVSVSADSGFHSKANVQWLYDRGIDGYLADGLMRKRDERFAEAGAPSRPAAPDVGELHHQDENRVVHP